jgi:hypothetical protein
MIGNYCDTHYKEFNPTTAPYVVKLFPLDLPSLNRPLIVITFVHINRPATRGAAAGIKFGGSDPVS